MVKFSTLNFTTQIGTLNFDVHYFKNNNVPYVKIYFSEDDYKDFILESDYTNLITMDFLKFNYNIESLLYFEENNKSDFSNLNLNFDLFFELSGVKFELTKRYNSFFLSLINVKKVTLSTVFYFRSIDKLMEFVFKYNANLCAIFIEYDLHKKYDIKFGKGEFIKAVWEIENNKFKIPVLSTKTEFLLDQFAQYKKEYDLVCKNALKQRYLEKIFPDINNKN